MSIEHAMIQRSRSFLQGRKIKQVLGDELGKGCSLEIASEPVSLLAPYRNVRVLGEEQVQLPKFADESVIFRIWISPTLEFEWVRSERFIKELCGLQFPVQFEIYGNEAGIQMQLRCSIADSETVRVAYIGEFLSCELTIETNCSFRNYLSAAENLCFRDYLPASPYHETMTVSDEFVFTPFETMLCSLSTLPESIMGFYQCIFQPLPHEEEWGQNIQTIYDLQYLHSVFSENRSLHFSAQLPSSELRLMSQRMQDKAHQDKALFAAALRVGLIGESVNDSALEPLTAFTGLFQQGGRQLRYIRSNRYDHEQQKRMLRDGTVYRNGFLVNSKELSGLVHVFSSEMVAEHELPIELKSDFESAPPITDDGTIIGSTRITGEDVPVAIDEMLRERSVHIIGGSCSGKSTVMIQMALSDVKKGCGLVFVDPHGDAVKDVISRIPEEHLERVIWFDPGQSAYIPSWNPLWLSDDGDLYRLADDTLTAIEKTSRDWGDRLAHILRNGLLGLLQSKSEPVTLLDLYHLVRLDSPVGNALRQLIMDEATDETVRDFWKYDFAKDYKRADLAAPKHKLDKLLCGGVIQLMFSQQESKINIGKIMEEGKILLVDLSNVGADARKNLGSFLLNQHVIAAFARSKVPYSKRKPFSIFIDECHQFASVDAIEDIIAQARKFRIRLTIGHQYLRQFDRGSQIDALSTVGTTLVGRLDRNDAGYFAKDLQGKVKPEDIVGLEKYQMFARLDTQICKIATNPLPEPLHTDISSIVGESYAKYYTNADELREKRIEKSRPTYSPPATDLKESDFFYDEF